MQIKLLTLDSTELHIEQQLRKVSEEHHEVLIAKDWLQLSEELIDLMQACKTALEIVSRYKSNYPLQANFEHIAKLKQRALERKIKLLEDE